MAMNYGLDGQDLEQIRRMIEQEVAERLTTAMTSMEERFQQMEERGAFGPQDVRMSCIHLVAGSAAATSPLMTDETLIKRADALAQYVLTGKKPGEASNG